MFFYVSDNSSFFWILFAFILLNFLLTIFMGSKRRTPDPIPMPDEEYDYSTSEKSDRDLAEEFERVLGKKRNKVHTDNCELKHEKAKIYTEPAFMAEEPVSSAKTFSTLQAAPKKRLKHPKLVQGLIMEQILDKPRALKPYSDEF